MKAITITETVVQWKTILVADEMEYDRDNPEENPTIRELMFEEVQEDGWDGTDVLEARWEVEDVV